MKDDIRKPFHESIVEAIKNCQNETELYCLLKLVRATKIPANHHEISSAIRAHLRCNANIKLSRFEELDDALDYLDKLQKEAEQQDKKKTARLSFCESIIDEVSQCSRAEPYTEMIKIMRRIRRNKIPKNHDKIIGAINSYFVSNGGYSACHKEIKATHDHLCRQKAVTKAKAKEKAESGQ